MPASAPLFIPFLGAVVGMKQLPKNAWGEAQVALAGPILGTLGALGVWVAGEALDSELLIALAFTGFFLNLFNLLPVSPLDGGRAAAALHPALWFVGLVGLARADDPLAEPDPDPDPRARRPRGGGAGRSARHPEAAEYYRVRPWQRVAVGTVYIGLAAFLVLAMSATHIERTTWP